jgi:hypothetical protein
MSQEYFDITANATCNESLTSFGWNLMRKNISSPDNPEQKDEYFRIVLKMVTEQYYENVTDVDQIYSAFYRPVTVAVNFNGSTISQAISAETTPVVYYRWLLESEDISPIAPKGNGAMVVTREYLTYGRDWHILPFTYTGDVGTTIAVTASSVSGTWFDRIEYHSDYDESDNEDTTVSQIIQTEKRNKVFTVSTSQIYDDISSIKLPDDGLNYSYVPIVRTLSGIYNDTTETTQLVADKHLLPFTATDFDYQCYFVVTGQELVPGPTRGDKTMILTTHYSAQGAQETRILTGTTI